MTQNRMPGPDRLDPIVDGNGSVEIVVIDLALDLPRAFRAKLSGTAERVTQSARDGP
jgi:hypothetical protein